MNARACINTYDTSQDDTSQEALEKERDMLMAVLMVCIGARVRT